MATSEQRVFHVGDEVYFTKYLQSKTEKPFRSGTVALVEEITELEGKPAYVIATKKGVKDTVLAEEIKIKRAVGTLQKETEEKVQKAENRKKEKPEAGEKKQRLNKDVAKQVFEKEQKRKEDQDAELERRFTEREDNIKVAILQMADGTPLQKNLTNELNQLLVEDGADSLELARHMYSMSQKNYFNVGGVIAHIFVEDEYRTKYGYNSKKGGFNKFIEDQIKSMGWRKARSLMRVYLTFTTLGISPTYVEQLGWTACDDVCSVANARNIQELLDYASTHTTRELKAEIKANYRDRTGTADEEVELEAGIRTKFKHATYSFVEEDYTVIEQALALLGEQYPDIKDPAKLLFMLASDYIASSDAEAMVMTEEVFINQGQAMFPGKEVFIRDKTTGRVINPNYGEGQVSINASKQVEQAEQEVSLSL